MRSPTGAFSVFQFFPGDMHEQVATGVGAEEAMRVVVSLVHSVGGKVGTTQRVIITDREDFVTFEWRYGEGVVFPTKAECDALTTCSRP